MKNTGQGTPPARTGSARRRKATPTVIVDPQIPPGTKQIDVGPLLDTAKPWVDPDASLTLSKAIGAALTTIQDLLPLLVSWGVTFALIFGGCCSNVKLS